MLVPFHLWSNAVLCSVCNADWRLPVVSHIERGCCSSPLETKQKVFAAMCRSNVLLGGHGGLPSKHRIGSTTGANADQSGGIMLHDFLPRALHRSFGQWVSGALPANVGDDDYRAKVRKKTLESDPQP